MKKLIVYLIAAFHIGLVLAFLAAFFILPFAEPWYVAAPLMGFLGRLVVSRDRCPITDWEDAARKRAGMPPLKGKFFELYFVGPFMKLIRRG